jgi:hypothetical protein
MVMVMVRLALFATLLLGATGCPLLIGAGRARTLPVGRTEITLVPEATVLSPKFGGDRRARLPWAQLRVDARRGLGQRLEAGARVWGMSLGAYGFWVAGVAGDAKLQLRRVAEAGPWSWKSPDVAVAATVAYQQVNIGGTPQHHTMAVLPLLLGWRLGGVVDLVVSPRVAYERWTGESQYPIDVVFGGASLAVQVPLGKRFTLAPELGWLYSPVPFNGEVDTADRRGLSVVSLGIGVGFGL